MNYKLLMESWREFIAEQVNLDTLDTSDLSAKESPKRAKERPRQEPEEEVGDDSEDFPEDASDDSEDKPMDNNSGPMMAQAELVIFGGGTLTENMPESWPEIAKFWSYNGQGWLATRTMTGDEYPTGRTYAECHKNGKKLFEKEKKYAPHLADNQQWRWNYSANGKVWEGAYWSAAFIQYCMQNNEQFKKLKTSANSVGSHGYYTKPAKANTRKVISAFKSQGTLDSVYEEQWIHMTKKESKKIGYFPLVGDIVLTGIGHGDIVVESEGNVWNKGGPSGDFLAIGGNLGRRYFGSVKYAKGNPHVGVLTQNIEAFKKLEKLYNPIALADEEDQPE